MAKYRQIQTAFWDDPEMVECTPEQKYFFIYLFTNPQVKQCGIYQISARQMEYQTGYNRDTIEKLIQIFSRAGKIQYNEKDKEIRLCNFLKYNASKSPKVLGCIASELLDCKTPSFIVAAIKQLIDLGYGSAMSKINSFEKIGYRYPMDTVSQEKEEEKEEEKEQQQECDGETDKEPCVFTQPDEQVAEWAEELTNDEMFLETVRYMHKITNEKIIELLKSFLVQKRGLQETSWPSYSQFRKNFLFWIPKVKEGNNAPRKNKTDVSGSPPQVWNQDTARETYLRILREEGVDVSAAG